MKTTIRSSDTPRSSAKKDRERDIVAAARALFREKSYDATSIAEVAARAGMATGTVYLYAEDKADLLHKVLIDFVTELTNELETHLGFLRDPLERVRFVVGRHLATMLAEPELCALFVREVHVGGREGPHIVQKLKQRYSAVLTAVLDEAMTAGVLRRDVPLGVARAVIFGALEQLTLKTWTGKAPIDVASGTDGLMRLLEIPKAEPQGLIDSVRSAVDRLEGIADTIGQERRTDAEDSRRRT